MTDIECLNCGGDNLDDYPVCGNCAPKCHFPASETCRHCAAAASTDSAISILREVRNSQIDRLSFRGHVTITISRNTWTRMSELLRKIEGGGE